MADYFGLKIGIDGDKEFKQNLRDITQSLRGLGTELTLCASQFDKQDKSTQALTAQNEALVKAINTQKDLIESLEKGLERASTAYGETDTRTKSWAIQLNLAKTTLNEMERELKKNNAALGAGTEQYDKSLTALKNYTERNKELSVQFDAQQSKVEAMQKHLQRASDIYGENSDSAERWRKALANAQTELDKIGAELKETTEQIKKHSDTLADAEQREQAYKKAVGDVNQTQKMLTSELKLIDAQYGKNNNSLDALSAKNKVLTASVSEQQQKIVTLREALKNATDAFGESDSRTKEWAAQLNNAEAELVGMERELKNNNTALLKNSDMKKGLIDRAKDLVKEIKDQKSEIGDLKKKLDESASAYGENDERTQEWANRLKDAEKKLDGMNSELDATKSVLKDSEKAFREAGGEADKFGNNLDDAGKKSLSLGDIIKANLISDAIIGGFKLLGTAIKEIGSSLTDAFKDVLDVGMEFESAFAGIRKTVDATEEEFGILSDGIRKMATEIPVGAAELSNLGAVAGQLGIETDSILDFTRVMADMGVATNLAGEEGAAQLAKFANITQMSQADFDKLGSSIVALGNNFATTEQDIMNMAMRLGGAGTSVGMSQADILGLATALSSMGIEAEMGGSAISKVMVRMSAAASTSGKFSDILSRTGMSLRDLQLLAANNSKDFKGLAGDLGMTSTELNNLLKNATDLENFGEVASMSAAEFKQAYETDAVGALQQFMLGLGDVESKGQSTIEMLQDMGINEVRLRDSLLRAASAGEQFGEAIGLSNQAWENNSALAKEAAERYNTLENNIQTFRNNVDDFRIEVFDGIQDTLKELVGLGTDYVSRLSTAFKEGGIDALLDEAGNVIADIVVRLSQSLPQFITVVSDIMLKIAEAVAKNAPVLISQLVSAVAKLAPSIAEIGTTLIVGIVKGIIISLPQIIDAAFGIVKGLADGIGKAVPLLSPFTAVISGLMSVFQTLAPVIAAAGAAIGTFTLFMNASKIAAGVYGAVVNALTAIKVAVTAAQLAWNAAILANPIGLIIAGVAALTVGIIALVGWLSRESEESKALSEQTERLVEANNELVESTKQGSLTYSDQTFAIETNAAAAKSLADRISELSAVENKSAEQKQELAAYVGMLNEAVGETVVEYNAETDALSQNMAAIYSRIEALQAEAKEQAARERAVEIAKEQMVVEEQLNKINEQRIALDKALEDGVIKKKKYNEQVKELDTSEAALIVTQDDLSAAFDNTTNTIIEAAAAMQEHDAFTTTEARRYAEERGLICDETVAAFESVAAAAEESAIAQQKALEMMSEEYTKLKDTTTDMFSALSDEIKLTVGDMQTNLEENQRVVSEWAENIALLADSGIDDGLLEVLRQAGPSSAGYVKALVNASDDELSKLSDTFTEGGEVAMQALAASLGVDVSVAQAAADMVGGASDSLSAAIEEADFGGMGEDVAEGFSKGIEENTHLAEDAAGELGDAVSVRARETMGINSPSTVFIEIGENVVDGLVKGIEDKAAKAQEAMESLMLLLSKNAVDTITQDVKVSGENMVNSIADGVTANKRLLTVTEKLIADAKRAAQTAVNNGDFPDVGNSVVDDVYSGVRQKETWFKQSVTAFFSDIGKALMEGLKSGIDSKQNSVSNTLVTIGKNLVSECKNVLASSVFYNIGDNLMLGLGNGIAGAEAGVRSVLTSVGHRLVSDFKSLLEIQSPSKVFAKLGGHLTDGLAVGIDAGGKDVTNAIGDLADNVVDNINGISPENNMFSEWGTPFDALKNEFDNILSTLSGDSVLTQFDEVGKSMASHIRQGFSDEISKVVSDMQSVLPSNSFADIGRGTAGGIKQAGVNGNPLVSVQQMIVRSDDDIRRVSQELYNLIDIKSRSQGYIAATASV